MGTTRKLHMTRALADARTHDDPPPGLRTMTRADIPALGRLFYAAYLGTVDYEGESEADAEDVARATFDGEFGDFVEDASFVVERDGDIVSASFITTWQAEPLLAFAVTAPPWKGRRLAQHCTSAAMRALAARGDRTLHLFVTATNAPARALYERMGFAIAPA
jgi:ribosomal protein S18 acetylase RimI-like enzyme